MLLKTLVTTGFTKLTMTDVLQDQTVVSLLLSTNPMKSNNTLVGLFQYFFDLATLFLAHSRKPIE